eukprot:sb/3466017/
MIVSDLKLCLLTLSVYFHTTWCADVSEHLNLGTQLLRAGNLGEALNQYHAAVGMFFSQVFGSFVTDGKLTPGQFPICNWSVTGDAKNYLAYYQRATVFLALGRHRQAMADFDSVIKIKPDFHRAKTERAGLLLKQGKTDEAKLQYSELLTVDGEKASEGLREIPVLEQSIEDGDSAFDNNDYANAIDFYDKAIDIAKWDISLREKRSNAYLKLGNIINAIGDVRAIAKLTTDNTAAYLKLSHLHYVMGEEEESLKVVGKRGKWVGQWSMRFWKVVDFYDKAIDIAKWDISLREKRSNAYLKLGNIINAIGDVRAIAKLTTDNTAAYLKLSHLHYVMGEEEESLNDLVDPTLLVVLAALSL